MFRRNKRQNPDRAVEDNNFYESMPIATPMAGRQPTYVEETDTGVNRGALLAERVVSYIVGVVETLLGLRLLLSVLGSYGIIATTSELARFIYTVTQPLIAPFANLFNTTTTDPGALAIAFAMLIYALIGYGVIKLFRMLQPRDY